MSVISNLNRVRETVSDSGWGRGGGQRQSGEVETVWEGETGGDTTNLKL